MIKIKQKDNMQLELYLDIQFNEMSYKAIIHLIFLVFFIKIYEF